ncbi:hypothetical protein [Burkholderia anthina]|uniref:hypothetical protein n=1 Tax=Burkholderia anthina TaxID=179879 RepID=UPI00158EAFA9|nr:hypothetical protein [Burkholderia anthina]
MQNPNPDEPQYPLDDNRADKVRGNDLQRLATGKQEKSKRAEQDRRPKQVDEQVDRRVCRRGACGDAAAARPGRWRTPIFNDSA